MTGEAERGTGMGEKPENGTRFGVSDWIEAAVWVVIAIGAIGWCVNKFTG